MNPTWAIYSLQILQGHSLFFLDLVSKEPQFFISFGTVYQIYGPKYLNSIVSTIFETFWI